ncbi:MAG: hypothetical protein HOV70_20260 [Streptomyces sp.]|nr:hypothetical protein [Streptomyces sp.]
MSPRQVNASRSDIIAMLRDGHSNSRIARELRVDKHRVRRIRADLGLANVVQQPLTLEEKWATHTRAADGGHLEWIGERAKASGTPVMRYKEVGYSPAAVAFQIQHGRSPEGYVKADCDFKHCVAPGHVNDEAGRREARQLIRARSNMGEQPTHCAYGHAQTEHGKFEPNGVTYCGLCKKLDKQAQRDPSMRRPTKVRAASLEEAFRAHTESIDGGHVRWTGSASHTTPTVWFDGRLRSAYKIAFHLHHGREPQGIVTSTCAVPLCVSGWHVADRLTRQQTDAAFEAIFGSPA